MKTESIVYTKAFEFAIQIIELYKQLINEKKNMLCPSNCLNQEQVLALILKKP